MNTASNMSNDIDQPQEALDIRPTIFGRLAARGRLALAKKQSEATFEHFQKEFGPQAEHHTASLYSETSLVPLDKIIEDPKFQNFRQKIDPVKLADLQTSIELDGLRVPVTVIQAAAPGFFHVRAGFRRTQAVRNLGWEKIPAIVLPADMPRSEEYWVNILENTNRDKLSTYELACAAKKMRDEFRVSIRDFARKTGHSPDHVSKLLACVDRLPHEVLQSWKNGDQVPFSIYFDLSCMTPVEAVKNLRLWMGQRRIVSSERQAAESLRRLQSPEKRPDKLWTVRGVERAQRLLMAIKVSKLEEKTKEVCVKVVEYCLGCRQRVDGVVDDRKRLPLQDFTPPVDDDTLELEVATGFRLSEGQALEEMNDEIKHKHNER
jgi:ParB/RepB/Spo0J family partition protein